MSNAGSAEIPEVDVAEAARRQGAGSAIIDVREADEWAKIHARDAMLFPLSELQNHVADLPRGELLMLCRSGGRSMKAAELLASQGFSCANIAGGTMAWVEAGLPTESGS
ncbi:MAG: rhodanese-like domain-containing protein [Actinomycetia bacterium]|nr:rhodanese-like domain-containing protein [Actinomycetes bacterium]MCP3910423.1 rhodanese-like domain-containing protein [Actinomycetes bacterium]MCP4085486.1 rhodanese-like domain-containing protein [Actinomycetes bacterium]